jgi:hypothetical protein
MTDIVEQHMMRPGDIWDMPGAELPKLMWLHLTVAPLLIDALLAPQPLCCLGMLVGPCR